MADTREPQSLIESAEQAAKAGNYAAAERLLRDAADLQASGAPAERAELANTLNNLGVVCELTDNTVEAERCFRRAHEIAVEVLEPDHPFVTTSRKNLEDFCRANGKEPFPDGEPRPAQKRATSTLSERTDDGVTAPPLTDLLGDFLSPAPPSAPTPTPTPPPAVTLRATPSPTAPQPAPSPEPPPIASSSRPMAIGLVAVAVVFALFLARSLFFRDTGTRDTASVTASSEPTAAPATPTTPAPTPAPAAPVSEPVATPPPAPVARTPQPQPKAAAPPKSAPPAATRSSAPSTAAKGSIGLVNGAVCRNLRTGGGEWRCDPAGSSVSAGQLYFYTRVKSDRGTVVQHRWYRGGELRKSIDLEIAANPGQGYRTYSRNTVSAGDWRVELRTKSGDVLHEERFTVR